MPGIVTGGVGLAALSVVCLLIARSGKRQTLRRNTVVAPLD